MHHPFTCQVHNFVEHICQDAPQKSRVGRLLLELVSPLGAAEELRQATHWLLQRELTPEQIAKARKGRQSTRAAYSSASRDTFVTAL